MFYAGLLGRPACAFAVNDSRVSIIEDSQAVTADSVSPVVRVVYSTSSPSPLSFRGMYRHWRNRRTELLWNKLHQDTTTATTTEKWAPATDVFFYFTMATRFCD